MTVYVCVSCIKQCKYSASVHVRVSAYVHIFVPAQYTWIFFPEQCSALNDLQNYEPSSRFLQRSSSLEGAETWDLRDTMVDRQQ